MTTTREAALEAAITSTIAHMGKAAAATEGSWFAKGSTISSASVWEWINALRAALSTPATEPQGYVDGLEAHIRAVNEEYTADQDGPVYAAMDGLMHYLAARPAPQPAAVKPETRAAEARRILASLDQPAADTRVVTVAQLRVWAGNFDGDYGLGVADCLKEIRAIIDNATPATPATSDKIAEARGLMHDIMCLPHEANIGVAKAWAARADSALRALAGKGEPPINWRDDPAAIIEDDEPDCRGDAE